MRIYSFQRVQNIPTTLDKARDFFPSPDNLARITLQELKFDIITRHPADYVYAGELIEYKLSPLPAWTGGFLAGPMILSPLPGVD
jgi:hypothetical protein